MLLDKWPRVVENWWFIECPTANKVHPIPKAGIAIVILFIIAVDPLPSSLDIPCWLLDIQFRLLLVVVLAIIGSPAPVINRVVID